MSEIYDAACEIRSVLQEMNRTLDRIEENLITLPSEQVLVAAVIMHAALMKMPSSASVQEAIERSWEWSLLLCQRAYREGPRSGPPSADPDSGVNLSQIG